MAHPELDEDAMLRMATMVAGLAAGWLTNHLVAMIWKAMTGHTAPRDLDDENLKLAQAVGFAAVSGGVAVLVNRLLRKGAVHVIAGGHHSRI